MSSVKECMENFIEGFNTQRRERVHIMNLAMINYPEDINQEGADEMWERSMNDRDIIFK